MKMKLFQSTLRTVWNNYEKYKRENDETIKKTLFKEFEKDK